MTDRASGERPGERAGRPDAGDDEGPPGGVSCEQTLGRVYGYLDGELEPEMQERVHRHLEICRRCYSWFDFERTFLDHVKQKGTAGEPREGLEESVRRRLDEEA